VNKRLAKLLFLQVERLRGERVEEYLKQLLQNQHLPRESLNALQQVKLRALLKVAFNQNEFYRKKYSGLDLERDFLKLPLLTKDELRENYQQLVTAPKRLDLAKTSGSTGKPLKFYRDREVFGHTLASVYRAQSWYGIDIGAPSGMLWGIPARPIDRVKMHLRDWALNRFRERDYNLDPSVLKDFYQTVLKRRPEYLYGYSSMVYEFALFVEHSSASLRSAGIKAVICTAESIPDYQRAVMERVFGCPVVSEYGSAETGIISYQCPQGRHHVSDECVLLEILGDDGLPCPPGAIGRVVVSVLHSTAAPIIRYDLGDYASRADGVCECGVTLSLLSTIAGRTSGIIVTPSGRCFHSIVMYYVMKDYAAQFGGVRQFKARQRQVDRIELELVTDDEFTADARIWLEGAVKKRLGQSMAVDIRPVESIQRATSGKLSDFVSELDVERHLLASFRAGHSPFRSPSA
jgi:phenylacetate-CoA ligase